MISRRMVYITFILSYLAVSSAHLLSGGKLFSLPSLFRGGSSTSLPPVTSSLTAVASNKVSQQFLTVGNVEMRKKFEKLCQDAQSSICAALEEVDGKAKFRTDVWSRENGGGGGVTKVLSGGDVFEKAGVNVATVYGTMPQSALRAATAKGFNRVQTAASTSGSSSSSSSSSSPPTTTTDDIPFYACGISSVIHPKNPHCPTMHFNYRYFETAGGIWWFGGGTDITPSYLDEDDMKHFHGVYKSICDKHDQQFYSKFKKWADEYFYIPHRGETRGLGGIFYDDLNDRDPELLFQFAKDGLAGVIPSYAPIINKHKNDTYSQREKEWQQIRRGRYVEFNIIYDRGTIFGLKTGGRIESILMSLPELARWEYDHQPAVVYGKDSPEARISKFFKKPHDWV